jgi:transposase
MEVDVGKIDISKAEFFTKVVGSLVLLKPFMEKMGFCRIIDEICPADSQKLLSHGTVIELMVANRFLSPTPLYDVENWAHKAGVKEVYNIDPELLNDDRLGRTLDAIHEHIPLLKGEIALHIAKKFRIGLEHLHWDLTTFHFEGDYENQDKNYIRILYAKNKFSQEAKKSAKIGLNIANDGNGPVPVFYEPLDGNANGFKATVQNMENLKKYLKQDHIIRISDRGCFSARIVAETKKKGFDLISSISWEKKYEQILKEELNKGRKFEKLSYLSLNQLRKKDPSQRDRYQALEVDYKLTYEDQEYPLRLIFIKSDGKIKRDKRTRSRRIGRAKAELEELKKKVGQPYYRNLDKLRDKVNRTLKNQKVEKFFHPEFTVDSEGNLRFNYSLNEKKIEEDTMLDGIYVIGTTLSSEQYSTDKVFTLFKEQHYSESANKTLKNDIKLRPIFLQNQRRIESLVFVLFLALMVYMLIERIYRMNTTDPDKKGLTARTLIDIFGYYCFTIVKQNDKIQTIPNTFTPLQMEVFRTLGIIPWGKGT